MNERRSVYPILFEPNRGEASFESKPRLESYEVEGQYFKPKPNCRSSC